MIRTETIEVKRRYCDICGEPVHGSLISLDLFLHTADGSVLGHKSRSVSADLCPRHQGALYDALAALMPRQDADTDIALVSGTYAQP